MRSFEAEYIDGLWHLDVYFGSRPVLSPTGRWLTPIALGVLDDHSRLACHLHWYLVETTQALAHGFCQALQKRSLPRALMSDNGAAMLAEDCVNGLHALGIVHETTRPYSPDQNLFAVELKPHNRWGGFKALRERWLAHLDCAQSCSSTRPRRGTRPYSTSCACSPAPASTRARCSPWCSQAMGA